MIPTSAYNNIIHQDEMGGGVDLEREEEEMMMMPRSGKITL